MINVNRIVVIILFVLSSQYSLLGQHKYQSGFELLEQGAFAEASVFFEEALLDAPDDLTAKICYGRAVGLSSDPQKALNIFKNLNDEDPNSQEIALNLSEAYLWNDEPQNAKLIYQSILAVDPESFAGNLGYSNTLSILQEYEPALKNIDKTLSIKPGNASALNSKKYILLGLANQNKVNKVYDQSEKILLELNESYPNDQAILISLANLNLELKALNQAAFYFKQLVENNLNKNEAYLGLSYIALLEKRFDASIALSHSAIANCPPIRHQQIRSGISLVNALAAKGEFRKARTTLQELEHTYQKDLQIDLTRARLLVWDREPKKALEMYQFIEQAAPQNFEVKMGMAESHIGLKQTKEAKLFVEQALEINPGQTDAEILLRKLINQNRTSAEVSYFNMADNGNNKSQIATANVFQPIGDRHKLHFNFQNRLAEQSIEGTKASQSQAMIGDEWNINSKYSLFLSGGASLNKSSKVNSTAFLYKTEFTYDMSKNANLVIGAKKELHNYNVELIDSELSMHHAYLNGNFSLGKKIGLYSQYIHTRQSDQNQRNLLFTSLYKQIMSPRGLKVGANFLYFFYNQPSLLYFSPDAFNAFDGFAQFSNMDEVEQKFIYHAFGSIGLQKIQRESRQLTKRVELKLGYRLNPKSKLLFEYMSSDAAQSTATGYSVSSFGGRLIWSFN